MTKERLYAKKGLFGTTVFVDKQGKIVGKSFPNSNGRLIRDSKGCVTGKAYGNLGIGFSSDKNK